MSRKPDPTKDDSDDQLWQKIADGVTPLRRRRPVAPDVKTPPVAKPAPAVVLPKRRIPPPPAPPPQPDLSHGAIPGLDRRAIKRLRKGAVVLDDRLDLHGSTQSDAHHRLERFVRDSYERGHRLVLVITGKGLRPDGGVGILRESVPRWLGEAPNRSRILGYSYAAPKDGGEGALYVRLKRKGRGR